MLEYAVARMGIFSERKYRIPTPEQTYLEFSYAGFARRALAAAIDAMVIGLAWFFVTVIATLVNLLILAPMGRGAGLRLNLGLIILVASISLVLLTPFLYHFLLEYYWNGQTLGKRLLNIKVMRQDGVRLDAVTCLLRNLFRYVDALPLIPYPYLFGVWVFLLSRHEQRIGDMVAGTVVIALPRRVSAEEVSAVGSGLSSLPELKISALDSREERIRLLGEFIAVGERFPSRVYSELVDSFSQLFGISEEISTEEKKARLLEILNAESFAERSVAQSEGIGDKLGESH